MKVIDAAALDYKTLNEVLRQPEHDYVIEGCCGQRFIGAGMSDRNITVNGISGNALGAYLNNASITVNANAQDAAESAATSFSFFAIPIATPIANIIGRFVKIIFPAAFIICKT